MERSGWPSAGRSYAAMETEIKDDINVSTTLGAELDNAADKMHESAESLGDSGERARTLEAIVRLRGGKIAKLLADVEQIKADIACIKNHLGIK